MRTQPRAFTPLAFQRDWGGAAQIESNRHLRVSTGLASKSASAREGSAGCRRNTSVSMQKLKRERTSFLTECATNWKRSMAEETNNPRHDRKHGRNLTRRASLIPLTTYKTS
ncbi:unnamed protein product [Prorocentrum cordatum]|uniref:Uncharacterized protein n=1 Tax=Prorocentrum cordatum TaxID=2364126 RepID=A0ABN9TW00_9DINO|nr:unnamed protein product [Polarella glacialis]